MVKVSVIIPVYNVEKYLAQCLDSVCAQTLKDIEIICVNDGSTDGSAKILDEYAKKDARIRIITKKNAGLGAARNSGLDIAVGEYVAFIDSDDWVVADYYEKLYDAVVKQNADVSVSNMPYYYNDDNICFEYVSQYTFGDGKNELISSTDKINMLQSCTCCNKLYKRQLIEDNKLRFYEGKLIEDFPFTFLAISLSKKIVCLPRLYQYYRQQPQSIMHNDSIKYKKFFDALDNFNTLIDDVLRLSIDKDMTVISCLMQFVLTQTLSRLEVIKDKDIKQQYQDLFINTVKRLSSYDVNIADVYHNIVYKLAVNDKINTLFNIQYLPNKIKIKTMMGTILKIKKKGNRILWLLFGFIPVFKVNL